MIILRVIALLLFGLFAQSALHASHSNTQSPSHSTKNNSQTRTDLRIFVIKGHSPKDMQQKRWDLGDEKDIPVGYKNRHLKVPQASVHSIAYTKTKQYTAPNRYRTHKETSISPEAHQQLKELYVEAETPAIHEEPQKPKSCCTVQ